MKSSGRISAKLLFPLAQAAGYGGSARNLRRLVVAQKRLWRTENHRVKRPRFDAASFRVREDACRAEEDRS